MFKKMPNPKAVYDYNGYFVFELEWFLDSTELSLFKTIFTKAEETKYNEIVIGHNNKNCLKRKMYNVNILGENFQLAIIILIILQMLRKLDFISDNGFYCGSDGSQDIINLIKSDAGCDKQTFHSDYQNDPFDPRESSKYKDFHGASIIINHTEIMQCINSIKGLEHLPSGTFIIMRGDFWHAGDKNDNNFPLYRYFFYIDPIEDYREKHKDEIYISYS